MLTTGWFGPRWHAFLGREGWHVLFSTEGVIYEALSQWKGEAEGRYQGIRCKPRKLWVEQSIKTTSYKCHAASTWESLVPLCLRWKNNKWELFTTFDIWLKSANPLLLLNVLLPNGSRVPKKSGIGREKQMKHASSMVKCVHRNKYHTVCPKCISKQPVIVLKVKKMEKKTYL